MTDAAGHPALAGPFPHAIAHRGSRVLWPENTMVAFAGAVGLGFEWVETDLHLTRDGVVVCLHDDTLDRTTNGTGPVGDLDFRDVAALDAGFRHAAGRGFPFRGGDARVPSLEELVTSFPRLRVVADLKQDGLEEPLAALVRRHRLWDRIVVGSFDDGRLRRFREATSGRVATSTGTEETRRAWRSAWRGIAHRLADAIQVPRYHRGLPVVSSRTVAGFHRAGYRVHVWTVNRPREMRALLGMGVDGLITDRPDLLKQVLSARGEWAGS